MLACLTKKKHVLREAHEPDSPVKMARTLCVLALLCFASCVAEYTETLQGFNDLQLQQDPFPWLAKLQDTQELRMKQNLAQLLYKLFKSHGPNSTEKPTKERRELDKKMTTRGAGCRIFFWKSWTAC